MKITQVLPRLSKKRLFAVSGIIFLLLISPIIYVFAEFNFGGKDVKSFCKNNLIGKSAAEVKSMAANRGLNIIAFDDALYFFQRDRKGGHSCDVTLDKMGLVIKAEKLFRF